MTPDQQINRAAAANFDAALAAMEICEERQEAITERIAALVDDGAEFDPLNYENIGEALGNTEGAEQEALALQFEAAMREGRFEEAGRVLDELSRKYWDARAEKRAREELKEMW